MQHAWSHLVSTFYNLPARRALWIASSYDYTNPQWLDIGGGGYHLTNNNTVTFGYDTSNVLIPTVTVVSASTQYFSRADAGAGNWADLTGTETTVNAGQRGTTIYAIIRFTNAASANETIISKWTAAGNQRGYIMRRDNAGALRIDISVNGIASTATISGNTMSQDIWYFTAMQYDPSTNLSAWVNVTETPNAVGIPASIFDNTSPFQVGARGGVLDLADADFAVIGLYAAQHRDLHVKSAYYAANPLFRFGT